MARIFLGLGTNVGNRKANLKQAISYLEEAGLKLEKASSVYETEPIGVEEQEWFYNMVIKARTFLSPPDLLKTAKDIENEMGRMLSKRWGPRLIDIDLLMFDDLEIDVKINQNGHLQLPHSELQNRAFVLIPFLEIEPEASLPDGRHLRDFLAYTKEQKIKKLWRLDE